MGCSGPAGAGFRLDFGGVAFAHSRAADVFSACRAVAGGTGRRLGSKSQGQTNVPPGLSDIVALAAGTDHTVALKAGGTVVSWGLNDRGRTNVPPGLGQIVAVAAGGVHSLALRCDGAVIAWGGGATYTGNWPEFGQAIVPAYLESVVAIAAGSVHSVALKVDGTVSAWGYIDDGRSRVPDGLTGVVAIAAGGGHTVALKQDGTVVAWGDGQYGQATVPPGLAGVVAVAAGGAHTMALKQDGTVVAWGWNEYGQTNVPAGLSGVLAIAAGYGHSVAIKQDGKVAAWGYGAANHAAWVDGLNGALVVAAGAGHTAAILGSGLTVLAGARPVQSDCITNRGPVQVMLQSAFDGGYIFYTLDGVPAPLGLLYDQPFTVKRTAVLRAMSFSSDLSQSAETTLRVVIDHTLVLSAGGGGSAAMTPAEGPWPPSGQASVNATPAAPGWEFMGWLGDAAGPSAALAVEMSRDKSLRAVFGTTLSVTSLGAGSIDSEPPAGLLPWGTLARLSAAPAPGNYFVSWGGAAAGNSNSVSLAITNNSPSVTALFATLPAGKRTLTVVTRGNGRVDAAPSAPYYNTGTVVALTAVAGPGEEFTGWSDALTGSAPAGSVTLNTHKTVTAHFTARPRIRVSPWDGWTPEGFRTSLEGRPGTVYVFEASTNLRSWVPAGTVTNTLGAAQFTDPLATNSPARFYRAAPLP